MRIVAFLCWVVSNLLSSQIKALCVHEAANPKVEFVLAVKAMPLVNDVVSLWVFIGTLEPKDARFSG